MRISSRLLSSPNVPGVVRDVRDSTTSSRCPALLDTPPPSPPPPLPSPEGVVFEVDGYLPAALPPAATAAPRPATLVLVLAARAAPARRGAGAVPQDVVDHLVQRLHRVYEGGRGGSGDVAVVVVAVAAVQRERLDQLRRVRGLDLPPRVPVCCCCCCSFPPPTTTDTNTNIDAGGTFREESTAREIATLRRE